MLRDVRSVDELLEATLPLVIDEDPDDPAGFVTYAIAPAYEPGQEN